jgi:hypothetical protein
MLRFLAVAGLLSVSLLIVGAADAQQERYIPLRILPGSQGSGSSSTLEIPTAPRQPQALSEPALPMAPQVGPELEIPSRQLRRQPGYAQATVTVTNRAGVHITDLTKEDFRVFEEDSSVRWNSFARTLTRRLSLIRVVMSTVSGRGDDAGRRLSPESQAVMTQAV